MVMRLAGVLIGPAILAFLIVTGLSHVVPETRAEPVTQPTGLAWSGRIFKDRAEFARWLQVRGVSYEQWSRLHPGSPWATPRPAESASASEPRTLSVRPSGEDTSSVVVAILGGALVLVCGLLAIGVALLVRMRMTIDRLAEPSVAASAAPLARAVNGAGSHAEPRATLVGAGEAARRGVEAAMPKLESARLAARRTVAAAGPRFESAGLAARRGVEMAAAETAAVGLSVQYAIAMGRLRSALFYAFAGVLGAAVGVAIAILI